MSWLDRLRGKTAPASSAPQSAIDGVELPLGLRLGGAIAIDATAFALAGDAFAFAPPAGHVIVEAYGDVDLGGGARLQRFYLAEDAFLQVNTTAGVIDEMKYFVFHDTRNPATAAEFRRWVEPGSALGAPSIEMDARAYRRVWGETGDPRWAPPVVFDERVFRGRPATFAYALTHYSMLYQREVPAGARIESLLVSAEDYGPDEFCVTYSVGVDVTTADLEIT
jgi:hypothetical protein